ncbi:DNA-binding transcriptional LysR family regulator [Amorphus orientalis]|uniref:DNA-binding transcriptional LysR family regulator n=1 Tax=Amorphus orientalis TaxID=649198 RepID=A0AAE3VQJ2_9HYPH|nr:DNA-binding transcriptional LysR family regulator [Amorphus orientalis]
MSIMRLGSINSAAQSQGMTQPALSRSLKRLEDRLGVPLFVRHSTGMEPTRFARVLRDYAELMEFESDRVVEEIKLLNGAATGLVRLGIVPSVAQTLLPRALERARRQSPGIQVRVVEGSGDHMIAAVSRGEVDFAVVGMPHDPSDHTVSVTPLGMEGVCVAARSGHPLMSKRDLTIDDLRAYPWALPEKGNVIWYGFHALFNRAYMEPPVPAVSSNSVLVLKSMVLNDDYLTMMTRVVFAIEEREGLMAPVPLEAASWERRLAIARRATGTMLPAARLLLRELQEAGQDPAGI